MLAELAYHMPVFSAILLLVAGILIGYALWLPLRADAEGIAESLHDLSEQNEQQQQALREQRDAYAALERRYSAQQDEWTKLRVSSQRIEQAWDHHQRESQDIGQGLRALHELKEETTREIMRERQARNELADTLRETQRRADAAEADVAKAQQQLSVLTEQLDQYAQAAREHQQQTEHQHQLQQRVEQLQQTLEQSQQQLSQAIDEREVARGEIQQTLAEREALQHDLTCHRQTMDTIQRQRDQFRTELDAVSADRQALQESLTSAEQSALRHEAEIGEELEQLRTDCRQLTGTLEDQESLVRTLQIERDAAHAAAAEEQHKQQQLSVRLHQAQQEMDGHREQREELLAALRAEQARGEQLETQLQAAQRQARIAEERVLTLQPLEAELAGLIDQYNRATHTAQEVEQERDEAMVAVQRAQDTIIGLRSELNKHSEKIAQLRRDSAELTGLRTAHHEAVNTVTSYEATIADLREELTTQAETIASLTQEREHVLARLRRQNTRLDPRQQSEGQSDEAA